MPRWCWWLMLACFLLGNGGCAARSATGSAKPHYVLLPDNLPLGTEVCVPLVIRTETNQYVCMPVEFVRWWLRHSIKG